MQYASLFPGIDVNKPKKVKVVRTRQNKSHCRRQSWEDTANPDFYHRSLFDDDDDTIAMLMADEIPIEDEIPFEQLTPQEQELFLQRRKNVEVYEQRHRSRRPLYHPPLLTLPIDYYTCLWELGLEMRRQDLARRGSLRFASGVFLADKNKPEKGYRVQVWDNVAHKKQHVAYTETREEAELTLRRYWLKKGIDIHVELPPYFMELMQDAIDNKKSQSFDC